ncbi:MAG TPA: hypothetical protein VFA26_25280, partial [Gemmataceae bacterium]|nr:hypothetical protein [Gemmataceae bacterium]
MRSPVTMLLLGALGCALVAAGCNRSHRSQPHDEEAVAAPAPQEKTPPAPSKGNDNKGGEEESAPPSDGGKNKGDLRESFDGAQPGTLPAAWGRWTTGGCTFAVAAGKALSAPNGLAAAGGSGAAGRAWVKAPAPADVQAGAAVFLNSLVPAQVFIRGRDLDSATPTLYAAVVTRGLEVKLEKVVKGNAAPLGSVKSTGRGAYVSEKWVRVTLRAEGPELRVQLVRLDTNEYLQPSGQWQASPAWALSAKDAAITGPGLVGVGRGKAYAGTVTFDDFSADKPGADIPLVAVKPDKGTDPGTKPGTTPRNDPPPTPVNAPPLPRPDVPRHYKHIRICLLAYAGNPMGAVEDRLLRDSVDLVVPNTRYLQHISSVAPKTPQLIYTNTSNLYLDLLTDWLAFADAHNLSRESAFFHAAAAKPFRGDSPSSMPVTWFWKVIHGGPTPTDLTSAAHAKAGRVPFAPNGEALYLGYPDRFREINFNLASGAGDGWSAALEYPTAVDDAGKPTAWAALKALADTTGGLKQSGQVTFDPPADWKPAVVHGSARLYFVRYRTTGGGTGPVAASILGRDFVGAKGGTSGVIPAFDAKADANGDGYLDDAEYAKRAAGKDARFLHESRMLTESYGQMRFLANPCGTGFRAFAVEHHKKMLAKYPLAGGFFMDNSEGKVRLRPAEVIEPLHTFAAAYGAMLNAISKAIAPKWVLANTSGGGFAAEPVVQFNPAYFEEFGLRPLFHHWQQFEDMAQAVERRTKL